MPRLNGRIPKYRLHKASGQGIVNLDGQDVYCGPYHEPASKAEYDRLIALWLANGRRLQPSPGQAAPIPVTVGELVVRFWDHAERYYRKADGSLSREVEMYRQAVRPLVELYADTPATDFGPLALKAVRTRMIGLGWCRNHVNHQVSRIKSMFRWGTEEELVPGTVHHALLALKGLRRGRGDAPESDPVRPVPDAHVDAVKPHVRRQVWALIQLQLLTGARPGELVKIRPVDLDTTGDIWLYKPEQHKTAHHGHRRTVPIGPQGQEVIRPFLEGRATHAYLFSPAEAEAERREEQSRERKTPVSCGNRPGTNRKERRKTEPGDCYDVTSYRRAIGRGCDDAFPPPDHLARQKVKGGKGTRRESRAEWSARLGADGWAELTRWWDEHRWHPHQLRHNAATRVSKERGIDAARALLGHRSLAVTDVYAELDQGLAVSFVKQIG